VQVKSKMLMTFVASLWVSHLGLGAAGETKTHG
jgi:hypothetical protein